MRSPEAPNTTRLHGSACLNACGVPLPVMPCLPCDLSLQAGLGVSTKALPHGGEHFLGEGVALRASGNGHIAEKRLVQLCARGVRDPAFLFCRQIAWARRYLEPR